MIPRCTRSPASGCSGSVGVSRAICIDFPPSLPHVVVPYLLLSDVSSNGPCGKTIEKLQCTDAWIIPLRRQPPSTKDQLLKQNSPGLRVRLSVDPAILPIDCKAFARFPRFPSLRWINQKTSGRASDCIKDAKYGEPSCPHRPAFLVRSTSSRELVCALPLRREV